VLASWRPVAAIITVFAALLIFALKWSVLRTLGVCALLGVAAALVHLPVT
jgi:chromate transporter